MHFNEYLHCKFWTMQWLRHISLVKNNNFVYQRNVSIGLKSDTMEKFNKIILIQDDYPDARYLTHSRFVPSQNYDFQELVRNNHRRLMYVERLLNCSHVHIFLMLFDCDWQVTQWVNSALSYFTIEFDSRCRSLSWILFCHYTLGNRKNRKSPELSHECNCISFQRYVSGREWSRVVGSCKEMWILWNQTPSG